MKFFSTQHMLLSLLFVFCICLSGFTFAEKNAAIYKWTDSEGNIHYAARPGDKSAVKMNRLSKNFTPINNNDNAAEEKKKNREKMCLEANNTKKKYKSAPFLYREDKETKKQIRLTEQESKDAFLRIDKDISYWCNPQQEENTEEKQ